MRAPAGTASLHQFQGTSEKTTGIPSEGLQLSRMIGQRMIALGLVPAPYKEKRVISQDGLLSLRHFTNYIFTKNESKKKFNPDFFSLFKINL